MIMQHLAQPPPEEVERRSLGIVMLRIAALAHLRQGLAGNITPGRLQVVGA